MRAWLRLRQEELPKTHGGLVQKFSQILIKQEQAIPADVGRALDRLLSRRSQSRYDPHAVLAEADARAALRVAEQMVQALEAELAR